MKPFAFLAPTILILSSCIQSPNESVKPADDRAMKERLDGQNERLARLETELHEMRLLFTSQLKRIEEVAHQASAVQQITNPNPAPPQQPQQVVIMPQTPVVTHRWDHEAQPFTGPVRTAGQYTVQPGDTLSHIAQRHGVALANLLAANPGTDPLRLQVGKKLTIPGSNGHGTVTHFEPRTGTVTHTVQAGDTLSEIAQRHGVSLNALLSQNPGLDPARLRIGSRVQIPAIAQQVARQHLTAAPTANQQVSQSQQRPPEPQVDLPELPVNTAPAARPVNTQPTKKMFVRVPQSKTLAEIALDFCTDVETLNRLNLTTLSPTHRIPANTTLYVPAD